MSRRGSNRKRKPKCSSSKGAFQTRGAARRALEDVQRTEAQAAVKGSAPIGGYRCRECGWWHLTSKHSGWAE